MLQAIIPSKTRRKILALFFHNVDKTYHLRRVCREVDEEVNAVKRELDILEGAKILTKEKRLNKSIYTLNPHYLLFDEFLRLFLKENTLTSSIIKNLAKLGKVKFIAISNKLALKKPIAESEIYLLFVGTIPSAEVESIVEVEQKKYPFELNYTILTEEEFAYRKKSRDPFIWGFLHEPKVMLVGSEYSLLA